MISALESSKHTYGIAQSAPATQPAWPLYLFQEVSWASSAMVSAVISSLLESKCSRLRDSCAAICSQHIAVLLAPGNATAVLQVQPHCQGEVAALSMRSQCVPRALSSIDR